MFALDVLNPELSFARRAFIVTVSSAVLKLFVGQLEEISNLSIYGLIDVVFLFTLIAVSRKYTEYTYDKKYQSDN